MLAFTNIIGPAVATDPGPNAKEHPVDTTKLTRIVPNTARAHGHGPLHITRTIAAHDNIAPLAVGFAAYLVTIPVVVALIGGLVALIMR